jgi:hypothetical protein
MGQVEFGLAGVAQSMACLLANGTVDGNVPPYHPVMVKKTGRIGACLLSHWQGTDHKMCA